MKNSTVRELACDRPAPSITAPAAEPDPAELVKLAAAEQLCEIIRQLDVMREAMLYAARCSRAAASPDLQELARDAYRI